LALVPFLAAAAEYVSLSGLLIEVRLFNVRQGQSLTMVARIPAIGRFARHPKDIHPAAGIFVT
jgi:hypothetical protein